MSDVIPRGSTETRDDGTHLLRYVLRLPHPVIRVWAAVATPEGLPTWLCAADLLEPRVGGAVTLRRLAASDPWAVPTGDAEVRHTVAEGHVTAWDVERVAEYTVSVHGRIRFHLEPHGDNGTVLRFTNELRCDDDVLLDRLAGWHNHFELLVDALEGRPVTDWKTWTPDRWRQLRESYAAA
ncbi:SRPBCC domain-containing protein [Streptomyces peucetius]|uniref:SRPBCC domain-containing protein n=1 Tax=Streptomyces peucetius TaxID=1950 RepID=A0ABY6IA17_STRPE|nr:SRPBCC domain-containing protein [Streptomyces peucetius]UYQ63696.1 SRPBCC domain-containing protein [Streptomyces peucetius]